MTDDSRQALDELKRAATHKIRVADSVYGIIQLRNGRLVTPKSPEPDPERLDGAEHLTSRDVELNLNGWTFIHEPPESWKAANRPRPESRGGF